MMLPRPRAASALETGQSAEAGPRASVWPDMVAARASMSAAGIGPLGERDPVAEAALIRRRMGNYQRGLVNARKTRQAPDPASAFRPRGASLFIGTDTEHGADQ